MTAQGIASPLDRSLALAIGRRNRSRRRGLHGSRFRYSPVIEGYSRPSKEHKGEGGRPPSWCLYLAWLSNVLLRHLYKTQAPSTPTSRANRRNRRRRQATPSKVWHALLHSRCSCDPPSLGRRAASPVAASADSMSTCVGPWSGRQSKVAGHQLKNGF